MGGVVQSGINPESAGFIEFAQNLLNKPDPNTVEFGGIALHDTVGDLDGYYLQFLDGVLWVEGSIGDQPAGAVGAGTRMIWIPSRSSFIAATATGSELDLVGSYNAIFGINNEITNDANSGLIIGGNGNTINNRHGVVTGQNNTLTSGSFNNVGGSTNAVQGDHLLVYGSDNSINGNRSLLLGQLNNISTGTHSIINGVDFDATQVIGAFTIGENVDSDVVTWSQAILRNTLPPSPTPNSIQYSTVNSFNSSVRTLHSSVVVDNSTIDSVGYDIIVGEAIEHTGNNSIIHGQRITNSGMQSYLYGADYTNTENNVLIYQYDANPSIYAQLDDNLGQLLGVGFGRTDVTPGYVNFKGSTTDKAAINVQPTFDYGLLRNSGDVETSEDGFFYTPLAGDTRRLAYANELAEYKTLTFVGNISAVGNVLNNNAGGHVYSGCSGYELFSWSFIAQQSTGAASRDYTFSVRDLSVNTGGQVSDVTAASGTEVGTFDILLVSSGAFNVASSGDFVPGSIVGGQGMFLAVSAMSGAQTLTNACLTITLKRAL